MKNNEQLASLVMRTGITQTEDLSHQFENYEIGKLHFSEYRIMELSTRSNYKVTDSRSIKFL